MELRASLPHYDSPYTPPVTYPYLPEPLEEAALDALFGRRSRSSFTPFKVMAPDAATCRLLGLSGFSAQ